MVHALLSALVFLAPSGALAGWAPVVTDQRAYSAAITDLAGGRLEDAAAGFTAILEKDPDCGMALHGRGMAHLRMGKLSAAAEDLTAVVAAFPERPEGHTALSSVRFAQQDFAGAEQAARAAVGADPGDIDANSALQQVLLRTGDVAGAKSALGKARETLPPPIVACFEVQVAQEAGDTKALDAALGKCRSAGVPSLVAAAVSRATGDASIVGEMAGQLGVEDLLLHAQAVDLFNDGAYAEAAATLDQVLKRSGHRVDARLLRARARHATGDTTGALADLEMAFDADTWVDVHRSGAMSGILRKSDEVALDAEVVAGAGLLVQIHLDAKELDRAAKRLDAFEAELGPRPPLQAARAEWLRLSGDTEAGWTLLSEALATSPTSPHLLHLASAWAVAMPDAVPADVAARLGTSGSWQDAWNLAVSQRKAGDVGACHATAASALTGAAAGAPPDVQRKLAGLAHRCAVAGKDLAGADAMVKPAGGPDMLDPILAYNHAHLRLSGGDAGGALALIGGRADQPDGSLPDAARATVALALRAHLDLNHHDSAFTLASGPWATPEDQLVVASRLSVAGDDARARQLLDKACPVLSGDARTRCDKLAEVTSGAE